jgi:hypothetical protein
MEDRDEPQQPQDLYPSPPPEPTPQQDEPRQYRDLSLYSLTAEAASELFIQNGVPRSLRTMIRYCKDGTLDCIKVETERNPKYFVAPESVNTRIAELQQIMSYGHNAPRLDTARHDVPTGETRHDTTSYDAPRGENQKIQELTSRVGELAQENEELKRKNRDLEITNIVKDRVIEKNEGLLATAHSELMKFNRAVGQLAERLRLKAPGEDTSQIIAYLDAPAQAADLEHENLVDGSNSPLR